MISFIIKRLLVAIPTLLAIILLVFLLVHLVPGNPFQGEKAFSPEVMQELLHQYRLDLPLWKQFLYYVNDLLHGNFGQSYKFIGQSINELIFPDDLGGFWVTLRLAAYSMLLTVPLGIILGCYAGLARNSWFDKVVIVCSTIFSAVPVIVAGPLIILLFAVTLNYLPASGFADGDFLHLVLPVGILTLAYLPTVLVVARGSVIDVLNSNFIKTAKAKGLPTRIIIFKHALRPTLIPVISLLGPMFANVLVGAIVTEQVFALPGLGILTTNAVINRDYNLVLGITILGSSLAIAFNILVDIAYFFLDPRIKQ
ncbi:MAG: oligopeptide transport system permease protein [Pseudomonadota bacterium]|nr:oligopeptide transport system permease protein [Pseudomonadota bacterium]